MINNGSIERQAQKASVFYSCRLTVYSAQLGWKTTAINYLQAHYGHLPWFMGSFMEMHNTDRSSSGYKSRTQLSRAPTQKTDELKKQNPPQSPENFHFSECALRTAVALQVYTQTHTQMLAYIGLFLHVLLLLPMGSFLPLFSLSPAEKEKKAEFHCIHYACVRDFVCLTIHVQKSRLWIQKNIQYLLWLLQV